jgi:hypothetical protein
MLASTVRRHSYACNRGDAYTAHSLKAVPLKNEDGDIKSPLHEARNGSRGGALRGAAT